MNSNDNKKPAVTVPGHLVGLLDVPAPVYSLELGRVGHSLGPVTPPYEDRPKRIEVCFRGDLLIGSLSWEQLELDLTQEAGVVRALFWLGDRLGLETAEDRKLRSNPPHFAWDDEVGCWMLDDWYFGPEDNAFLVECEEEGFEPKYPSRFIKDLPPLDADDPHSWHKALRALMLHVEDTDSVVIIREELLPTPGLQMRQSVELAVGGMFQMLSELTGPHWQPLEVCFSHRPPEDSRAHRAFFRRSVKFNQEFNGLVCRASDLAQPRALGDQVAAGFARKYLEAALVDRSDSAQQTCRQIMLALLPGGSCTAAELARFLHVDRRTLQRRLAVEGLTFSGLLDQVRAELARRHLRESDRPLREVAELLGFSRPSSFSHWFERQFGCSASQWKKQAARNVAPDAPDF